ncbi:hypothetical protein PEP31012_00049 [Pandoraea eparura]|jgi:aldose 1-epimerase|uniref:Aldose 1-epimerase n=1 Tax=Pandoraea eparura TaxID=2508291 RepID=A0A5E4RD30_9BURK|nr:aldose 1-epimerase [Pandoraea eparura]VVD59938.1 hypothetical protein PEP31012_00049 [Pandoraea eparura]
MTKGEHADLEILALAADGWQVELLPALGGTVLTARWREHIVMRDRRGEALGDTPVPGTPAAVPNVRRTASYPLVPYSNRVREGVFTWQGARYVLRQNFAGEPHALHGFAWQRAWQVTEREANAVTMQLSHAGDADWPFACDVTQRISIDGDTLEFSLALTNRDTRDMPAGLGWHPFFPLTDATRLTVPWTAMLVNGADKMPTAVVPVPEALDFRRGRALQDVVVDNCFTGWHGVALVEERTYQMEIRAHGTPAVVFFRPQGQDFFAFEPVSHTNGALNGLPGGDVRAIGMQTLAPGRTCRAGMTFTLSPRTSPNGFTGG